MQTNELARTVGSPEDYFQNILDQLEISYGASLPSAISSLSGFVLVSNHPTGVLDAVVLGAVVQSLQLKALIIANSMAADHIDLPKEFFAFVELYDVGTRARTANAQSIRRVVRHVQSGGTCIIFPSGDVGDDANWTEFLAFVAIKLRLPIVPCWIDTTASRLLCLVLAVARPARWLVLPSEIFRHRGQHICVTLGAPISQEEILSLGDRNEVLARIKMHLHALRSP